MSGIEATSGITGDDDMVVAVSHRLREGGGVKGVQRVEDVRGESGHGRVRGNQDSNWDINYK